MLALSNMKLAGALLFVGAVQFAVSLILAEIYYPNYNVSTNYVSDLGATCDVTSCTVFQPASGIFTGSIIVLGLLVLASAYYLYRGLRSRLFSCVIAIAGASAIGVGLFPETWGLVHVIFSLVVFVSGGVSAITAYKYEKPPLSYFSVVLGIFALAALALSIAQTDLGLGVGGMERMIVYPVLLWATGFGGYLMASQEPFGQMRTSKE